MSKWDKLSMSERADYIKLAVDNGISNLDMIRDTYNSFDTGGPKYEAINPELREAGIGQRRVYDIPNWQNIDWHQDGHRVGPVDFTENTFAQVDPYTGKIIDPRRVFRQDNGKLGLQSTDTDFVIRPYQGYTIQRMPYHDTIRDYKVPVPSGVEAPDGMVYFNDTDEYFETPQFADDRGDYWEDPSENALNYGLASIIAAPSVATDMALGVLGSQAVDSGLETMGRQSFSSLAEETDNPLWHLYNPGVLLSSLNPVRLARDFNAKMINNRNFLVNSLSDNLMSKDELYRLATREYPTINERVNPWKMNNTLGRYIRYYTGKVKGALTGNPVELPHMYRKIRDFNYDELAANSFTLSGPTRWRTADGKPLDITNMTTDQFVLPHGRNDWSALPGVAIPGRKMLDADFLSTRPTDTFVRGIIRKPARNLTVLTDTPNSIPGIFKGKRINIGEVSKLDGSSSFTKEDYTPYLKAYQKATRDNFKSPTVRDYQFMDYVYRPVFKSDVVSNTNSFTEMVKGMSYEQQVKLGQILGVDRKDKLNKLLDQTNWKNVYYNPATPAEHNFRKTLGITEF